MPAPVTPRTPEVTVLFCDGHRCAALRHRTDTGSADGEASTLHVLDSVSRADQGR